MRQQIGGVANGVRSLNGLFADLSEALRDYARNTLSAQVSFEAIVAGLKKGYVIESQHADHARITGHDQAAATGSNVELF